MPTYDYACSGCKHRFERFEPIGAGGLKGCPKCGKRKAKRMIGTGAGLIFKGSGFYTTDSKSSAQKGGEGDKKKPDEGEAKKPEKEKEKKKEEKEHKK
jgi:putative FmdB family regulatory protein